MYRQYSTHTHTHTQLHANAHMHAQTDELTEFFSVIFRKRVPTAYLQLHLRVEGYSLKHVDHLVMVVGDHQFPIDLHQHISHLQHPISIGPSTTDNVPYLEQLSRVVPPNDGEPKSFWVLGQHHSYHIKLLQCCIDTKEEAEEEGEEGDWEVNTLVISSMFPIS